VHFLDNQPGMKIAFDVLVEAEFEILKQTGIQTDTTKKQWLEISCTGDLACNLDDFAISSTEEYSSRGKQSNPCQMNLFML